MRKTPLILCLVILLVSFSVSAAEKMSVDEGTLIKLNVAATDPDGDKLEYIFPEPFNDKGEWQTNYTDAGEYAVKLAVSDGEELTYKEFIIEIKDKDRAPEFKELKDMYPVDENTRLKLKLGAVDPDGDRVTFEAVNLPEGASFNGREFSWKPGYDAVMWKDTWYNTVLKKSRFDRVFRPRTERFTVRFIAKGKDLEFAKDVKIEVYDVNRRPTLDKLDDMTVYEGEAIILDPTATDPDNDRLAFSYSGSMNTAYYETGFDDQGDYEVKVTVSDGELSDTQVMKVTVKNKNRVPELMKLSSQTVDENNELTFAFKGHDADDDELSFVSKKTLPSGALINGSRFVWKPGFDAAGVYNLSFAVKDAEDESEEQSMLITVNNVNRPPVINVSEEEALEIMQGDTVNFDLDAYDPDGDNVTYEWRFGVFEMYEDTKEHARTFTIPGKKKVTAVVSDGEFEVEKSWNITVDALPVVEPAPEVAVEPVVVPEPSAQPTYATFVIE